MKRLFVGNLSFNSREDDVRTLFEHYGTVQQVQLVTDRDTGQSRGFAFVDMQVDSEAQAAINGLNGYELHGRALNVNEAREREVGARGGSGGGGGGNRRGGRSGGGGGSIVLEDGTMNMIQSPVIDNVPGAFELQRFFENNEWAMEAANPVAYAPHLTEASLLGIPSKSVLIQIAKGDQFVPNPANSALVRAGHLQSRCVLYRHDLASADNPALPKPAHGFMANPTGFGAISAGAQEQIAVFLASDGTQLIHPEPLKYFEVPVSPPLPEDLGFVP